MSEKYIALTARTMNETPSPRRAFTLIELLVVVAIISMLISMMLPSLGSARESSRTANCGSNMRQLAIAAVTYAAENQDWLNPMEDYRYPDGVRVETTFRYILWEYVGRQPSVYDCPSERDAVYADGISQNDASYGNLTLTPDTDWTQLFGVLHPYERWNASGIGIAGAHWIRKSDPNWVARPKIMPFGRLTESGYREGLHKSAEIATPPRLIWFGDGGSGTPTIWGDDNWWIKTTISGYAQGDPGFNRLAQNDYGCRRHSEEANYAFADGHVERQNANNLRCEVNECWWSVWPDVHKPGDDPANP